MKSAVERVEKPWGHELIWAKTDQYVGKILHIKAGHKLSLQYHEEKVETIYVYSGKMSFVYEDQDQTLKEIVLKPGDSYHIESKKKHRMIAIEDCDIFEVSTPQLHDVVRLDDSYGRVVK